SVKQDMAELKHKRLEMLRHRNLYPMFLLAVEEERRNDYATAKRQYRRAIALHEEEHGFYFGLARVQLHLGDARGAGRSLRRAYELSSGDMQAGYAAKLDVLRRKGL